MKHYRRTTSCWLISQALCFFLLLQGSGIAQALPLPPKQTFVSASELEPRLLEGFGEALPQTSKPASAARTGPESESAGPVQGFVDRIRISADSTLKQWLADTWAAVRPGDAPVRVVQAGGVLPLPPQLMSAVLGASSRGQTGPPNPPGMAAELTGQPAKAEGTRFAIGHKAATEEIPLLAGYNLISIPEEPADPNPAAVFAAIAAQLERVEAYNACDLADPWKLYDPADPAVSDLTVADHKIGMWVKTGAAAVLPSDGTLPATTTLDLCEGWNLIGFPAGQARHPATVLSPIAGKWLRVFAYDAFDSVDPWEVYDPNVPDWANDLTVMQPGRGYWLLATEPTTLEIRTQGPPPTVAITSPADLAVITEPTEVTGTVDSDRLESWTLTSRPIGDGEAVTLATGNAPVSGGALATFDPTLLLNGLYELELTATDVQGQQVTESIAVSVEGQMKIGHFTLTFVDLAVPVSGLDVEVVRTYDSRDQQPRDFGVGWSLDIRQGSYRNNRPPGDGWQFQTGFTPCDTVLESKSHLTVVRLSDQEVYRFALRLEDGDPTQGGCFAFAHFDFIDGPLPGATLEILGQTQVFFENGSDRVIDVDTLALYEPQDVRLTTRDGRIFELDLNDGVTLAEDLNGNQLTITPTGITHSSGKSIVFERDAEGRIVSITDPMDRTMSYAHDTAGDLVSFTDRAGAVTRFTYDGDHRLLDIENSQGVKPIRNEYDANGRLVRHIDAFGKVIELTHNRAGRREIATDRLGHSRVIEYDARGNVVRETDELDNAITRTFDARDNLLSETDPLGRTTTYTYTAANDLAAVSDPLGNLTAFTYNSRGYPLTRTDPRGGITTSVYDSRNNLTSTTDALGNTTTSTYDTRGQLLTTTDAEGNVSSFQYDAFGNLIRETDPLGNQTLSTYDAAGNRLTESRSRTLPGGSTETLLTAFAYDSLDRLITTTASDGSSTSVSHDLVGKVASRTDALGRVTSMSYDALGRLVRTDFPDGTTETRSYDAEGRLLRQTDRAGRTEVMVYDAAGRMTATTFADGASMTRGYDAAGQLVATTDARGNTTTFEYDASSRRIVVIDALGNSSSVTYDPNGNQTSTTDALGNSTTYTYDALNRLTAITHPDSTTASFGYDGLGRRIRETDQAGMTTEYAYDALGRLTSVEDALGQVTSYGYDEIGNRVAQTDASGNTTQFEYDSLGRQTARIFPDGARESFAYDAVGSLASHTDFNGVTRTFEYDANQRLTRRSYPDGSAVTFTYNATGQRLTAVDGRGTTTYAYDDRDRLIEKTDPTGHRLVYAYDLQGNLTSLTAAVGASSFTTSTSYDALNRPQAITDPQGQVAILTYDANGNRARLDHANGLATTYTYDALNRLTLLETHDAVSGVVQEFAYTLAPTGHRTQIDEADGTVRAYHYDDLYRLIQDRVTTTGGELKYQRDFVYDPVGNRTSQTIDEGSGPSIVSSTYDGRDRLLTAGGTGYSWDSNGSLTGRGGESLTWDFDRRLTSVTLTEGTVVDTVYDVDGNRVQTRVTPLGGPTSTVDYLVDTRGFLSHVVAEVVAGAAKTVFVRSGDELISFWRPAAMQTRSFHADGLGSVRLLTDATGSVTDQYEYTAFGELVAHTGDDDQPYRFAGEPFEPSARFYYNRTRWLVPAAGRFASVDSFRGLGTDPSSLHKYLYAENDPVNATDPSGLSTLTNIVFAVAILDIAIGGLLYTFRPGPAWKHSKSRWSKQDERDFRAYITANYTNYIGSSIDCADLAITLLVDFAFSKGLPVKLESSGSGTFDSRSSAIRSSRWLFREYTKARVNADMVFNLNTLEIGTLPGDVGLARPGDLMMSTGHTRVFLGAVGSTVAFVEGNLPPVVSYYVRETTKLSGTPSIRWWKDEVFGR